jgi:adenylosuccinate synthase
MTGQIVAVVGAQYGSEGKGAVAARLGRGYGEGDAFVRVAGPNAGHTAYDFAGNKFAFRQLPVACVVNPAAAIYIAAGSEIEPEVLFAEIDCAEQLGHEVRSRLYIDAQATVIEDKHKFEEDSSKLVAKLGSTGKGIGAARADRIMRRAKLWGDTEWAEGPGLITVDGSDRMLNYTLHNGGTVMIEGTQGYGLGLHAGHYPQCTSSDTRAIDFLSMAGVNPWGHSVRVVLATRVYPIRVAGNSGPLAGETTWAELGLPEERTTVTQKVRRVGAWDPELVRKAVQANGPEVSEIALTMLDQLDPTVTDYNGGITLDDLAFHSPDAADFIRQVEKETGSKVTMAGTSPTTMIELV